MVGGLQFFDSVVEVSDDSAFFELGYEVHEGKTLGDLVDFVFGENEDDHGEEVFFVAVGD